jgi:predicted regulator of Ras-like GTPase activity (Roadblock/LC7/MglB family)
MVEFRGGLLLMVPAGEGSHLAVLASDKADVGVVGHNMNELVEQIGGFLSAPPRLPRHGIDDAL